MNPTPPPPPPPPPKKEKQKKWKGEKLKTIKVEKGVLIKFE
jgi:hypothetical protein